jgi:hypothetical protein
MEAVRSAAWCLVIAGALSAAPAEAQSLPPEPPAPMPPATTLPTYRSLPLPPPEAAAEIPAASTLPSMRGDRLGAEAPAPLPPATTLPSFRGPNPDQGASGR